MSSRGVLVSQPWEMIAQRMRAAAKLGFYDGLARKPRMQRYVSHCRVVDPRGVVLLFTRDIGHHTSGWWKNPEYERCWHLSLSFWDGIGHPRPQDHKLAAQIVRAFFGDERRLIWCEPPYSPEGKRADVWHYRLFCDPHWQPIKPRGEVYSTEFTEMGWKTWSEVHGDQADLIETVWGTA